MTEAIDSRFAAQPLNETEFPTDSAHAEAWSEMGNVGRPANPSAETAKHLPEVQIADPDSGGPGLQMRADGQVEFENSKGAVSCPVPESKSYGQFLFFRGSSHERGKPEEVSGVCKDAIDQFHKLESADQAYELAAKIPDKNLAKAVAFSIFEKELQRTGVTLKDIAYDEVMSNDFRRIEEMTPEERQRRIESNEKRIKYKKALQEYEARPQEEISPEEAERRQQQLAEYLKEIGVSEDRIKINLKTYVPLGWDVRQMRGALERTSKDAVDKPLHESGGAPLSKVPQDHVFVRTNISAGDGEISTEYISAVNQSVNRAGVDLSFGGYPLVGFSGGKWRQEAEPAPEIEKAIRHSLDGQMDAEVWESSQYTKHEAAIERVILQHRGLRP